MCSKNYSDKLVYFHEDDFHLFGRMMMMMKGFQEVTFFKFGKSSGAAVVV